MLYNKFARYNIICYIYIMEYNIPVEKKDYYKAMLMVINFNLNLSNLEMDILSILLNNKLRVVNIDARDLLRKDLLKSLIFWKRLPRIIQYF